MSYAKIETLFDRDKTTFKVTNHIRVPGFDLVDPWIVEEKCDGMNIQVHLRDPAEGLITCEEAVDQGVQIMGRTGQAQFRPHWMDFLKAIFTPEKVQAWFRSESRKELIGGGRRLVLYGELMGPKINGNPHRFEDLEFRLFDIKVDDIWWMHRRSVLFMAGIFGLQCAPLLGVMRREEIVEGVRTRTFRSWLGALQYFEGVVCRPDVELRLQSGARVIWKLKTKDFACAK